MTTAIEHAFANAMLKAKIIDVKVHGVALQFKPHHSKFATIRIDETKHLSRNRYLIRRIVGHDLKGNPIYTKVVVHGSNLNWDRDAVLLHNGGPGMITLHPNYAAVLLQAR